VQCARHRTTYTALRAPGSRSSSGDASPPRSPRVGSAPPTRWRCRRPCRRRATRTSIVVLERGVPPSTRTERRVCSTRAAVTGAGEIGGSPRGARARERPTGERVVRVPQASACRRRAPRRHRGAGAEAVPIAPEVSTASRDRSGRFAQRVGGLGRPDRAWASVIMVLHVGSPNGSPVSQPSRCANGGRRLCPRHATEARGAALDGRGPPSQVSRVAGTSLPSRSSRVERGSARPRSCPAAHPGQLRTLAKRRT